VVGATVQLSNTTPGGVWSAGNGNATVSTTGLVKGITVGNTVISYTVTNANGCSATVTYTVTVQPACVTPVATIVASNADAFCNKLTLTGNSTVANATYKWTLSNGAVVSGNQQISLGLSDGDGVYQLVVSSNGCTSAPVTYNYQKQTLVNSYTLLAKSLIQLGDNNTVASGSVGVITPASSSIGSWNWNWYSWSWIWAPLTNSTGSITFGNNSTVSAPGSFVKASYINTYGNNINIANPIYSAASGITLPTMFLNTVSAGSYSNYTVNSGSVTLSGNYNNLTIKKGAKATLNGTIFGYVRVEQGAQIIFTAPDINIGKLEVVKGPRTGYTYVRFTQNTKLRISSGVTIGSQVFVNPDNKVVTFYLGDNSNDIEKFTVSGGDTRVNANIYAPSGIINVTGGYRYGDYGGGYGDCDRDDDDAAYYGQGNSNVYMTGFYIADQIQSNGKNVIWNTFDCSASPVPVLNYVPGIITQSSTKTSSATEEITQTTTEELKITVMPNPSTTYFTLKFESKYETPLTLRVMDASGRVVDAQSKIGANSTLQIGANYASGTYYAEITQGGKRKVIQLIKARG